MEGLLTSSPWKPTIPIAISYHGRGGSKDTEAEPPENFRKQGFSILGKRSFCYRESTTKRELLFIC